MSNRELLIVGGLLAAYIYWNEMEKAPDYRKMESSRVNQYRVGPYQRSYGSVPYSDPNSMWSKFRDKYFGTPRELVFNPAYDRRSNNMTPF